MSEAATRADIDEVLGIMKDFMGQTSAQFESIDHRFESIDQRFESIDHRFESIDHRFDEINERLDSLDKKYDHLITTIDSFLSRIDKYETELAARDSQFERLLTWARKVSEKTGIPLENL